MVTQSGWAGPMGYASVLNSVVCVIGGVLVEIFSMLIYWMCKSCFFSLLGAVSRIPHLCWSTGDRSGRDWVQLGQEVLGDEEVSQRSSEPNRHPLYDGPSCCVCAAGV